MNIINNAYAQAAGPADGGMSMLIMVVLFFIIFTGITLTVLFYRLHVIFITTVS